ncbi:MULTISPECIES: hypothetical protein [Pseudomonas]|uniref:Uncharacterized protein n=1 Tax=Pseudomonas fluorescens TaxID=294 RepID=A0A5E6VVT8_PSEFL|nr:MULTISPECIES: hypothetical protein [Pseudomonas]VVN18139.1 hypothetical protein PS652_04177 [Pseudomonas fluorescens]
MEHETDHACALAGVMDALPLLADDLDEDDVAAALQQQGYSRLDAEKLTMFVPSAFSWVVLKRLGIAGLPNHFVAYDEGDKAVKVPVAGQHYFTAALTLAYETFEHGWSAAVPRSTFERVAGRSAEMDAVNKVLEKLGSVEGATIQPLQLFRLSAEELLED